MPLRGRMFAASGMVDMAWGGLVWVLLVGVACAQSGDPALPGQHPLTRAQAGDVLLSELRCAACHQGVQPGALPGKTAPDLVAVGGRVAPIICGGFSPRRRWLIRVRPCPMCWRRDRRRNGTTSPKR